MPNNYEESRAVKKYLLNVLQRDLADIKNVSDWADKAGYSRSWLSRKIKSTTGRTANMLLREYRFKRLVEEIKRNPLATSAFIANTIAPWNEKRLYNFLSKHHNTNISKLRLEILGAQNS